MDITPSAPMVTPFPVIPPIPDDAVDLDAWEAQHLDLDRIDREWSAWFMGQPLDVRMMTYIPPLGELAILVATIKERRAELQERRQ